MEKVRSVESIIIDFPHGATRLLVERDGTAFLFYGALPQRQEIKKGTFDVDRLYAQLQTRLHENVPREQWPDPAAQAGMVAITFADDSRRTYLLFDEAPFADSLFFEARENVVGQLP